MPKSFVPEQYQKLQADIEIENGTIKSIGRDLPIR